VKIFAAGISTESNTFCPIPTSIEDFLVERGSVAAGGEAKYPNLDLSRKWGAQAQALDAQAIFSLMAWAKPAGITVRSAYETLRSELLRDLRAAMPVDVVLLNLHGAMIAEGYEDCEEDIGPPCQWTSFS
jgi:microcystin degradation protein MlrC